MHKMLAGKTDLCKPYERRPTPLKVLLAKAKAKDIRKNVENTADYFVFTADPDKVDVIAQLTHCINDCIYEYFQKLTDFHESVSARTEVKSVI